LGERGRTVVDAYRSPQKALLVGDPPFTEEHLHAMEREEEESGPASTLLAYNTHPIPTVAMRSALAGNTEILAGLPRLPHTRREITGIAAVIPRPTTLLGPDASEERLSELADSDALKDFDTVHLATHALVNDERPEQSALALSRIDLPDPYEAVMSGERPHDGLLTAREIVRDWDLDADLVALSGCRTGLGRETAGEGYVGLSHAFLQAGARSVLVSLWMVEDEATSLLMNRFYENLTGAYEDERMGACRHAMPKTEALREAKHWLRNHPDHSLHHPSFWSGFILVGEP
jgi:CHAT domain-containing protein